MEISELKQKKVKVRGIATYNLTDKSFDFTAYNEGPSTQTNLKRCAGGGKRWTTTGSSPLKMLTLKCKESSPDPYAELCKQFAALTRDLKPKKPVEQPLEQRVAAESGMQCWLDTEKSELAFSGTIDLTKHSRDWQAEVLRQVQLMVRRLPANERFSNFINKIKKDYHHA
ncbi:MAG: hypothetical protein IKR98_07340 [Bacteroidaceae bacterium]|nr:hypothetical protein [Bacteroidaceae bacterium]